ncbi:STAS domain-containing protein [bacterium]|nr:STAS domain-containing protein [bacterium]
MPTARITGHQIHYSVSDGYAIVRPEGACDEGTTQALAHFVNSPMIESRNLILDLSRSKYVETPGYRWIVRQFRHAESAGKSLVVVGLPPSVERAFNLLKLDKIVPTVHTVPEALDLLGKPKEMALSA